MTSAFAVSVAAFVHGLCGVSVFISQGSGQCSDVSEIASWIFLIAFLYLDLPMAERHMNMSYVLRIIMETFLAILVTEVGTIGIWCNFEKILSRLVKYSLLTAGLPVGKNTWEYSILGFATMAASLITLVFVAYSTNYFYLLMKKLFAVTIRISKCIYTSFKFWKRGGGRDLTAQEYEGRLRSAGDSNRRSEGSEDGLGRAKSHRRRRRRRY